MLLAATRQRRSKQVRTLIGALWISAITWLVATPVHADESQLTEVQLVTIDELVNTVLQHNAGLNAARRTVDIATASITSAAAYPNPRDRKSTRLNSSH